MMNLANSQAKSIFLLAVKNKWDGVVLPECSPYPCILKLNVGLQWEKAKEPLHAGIDVNISNGIGPGMAFANSLLKKCSSFGVVGLVPCVVTGTKIIEWQKETNLYDQLVSRAQAALQDGCGTIAALLWYQGESDSVRLSDANAYKRRLQQCIRDLRGYLNLPELLVIQVALASGRRRYLEIARECANGKGLPRNLITCISPLLGDMLFDAFLSSLQPERHTS